MDQEQSENVMLQREIECRREKELAVRELEIARRELELLRCEGAASGAAVEPSVMENFGRPERAAVQDAVSRINIAQIADLLGYFDGNADKFEILERQVRRLKITYQLSNDMARILIGS